MWDIRQNNAWGTFSVVYIVDFINSVDKYLIYTGFWLSLIIIQILLFKETRTLSYNTGWGIYIFLKKILNKCEIRLELCNFKISKEKVMGLSLSLSLSFWVQQMSLSLANF